MRREVDAAMRVTTATLSQVTDLLAAVSAPPLDTATIKHVEVLLLQPRVALVVVITSTGAVTKRAFTFDEPLDPGLAEWAASVLQRAPRWHRPGCSDAAEPARQPGAVGDRAGVPRDAGAGFPELADTLEQTLYVEGAARLLEGSKFDDLDHINDLMRMLERRMTLLSVLRSALGRAERSSFASGTRTRRRSCRRRASSPPDTAWATARSAPSA